MYYGLLFMPNHKILSEASNIRTVDSFWVLFTPFSLPSWTLFQKKEGLCSKLVTLNCPRTLWMLHSPIDRTQIKQVLLPSEKYCYVILLLFLQSKFLNRYYYIKRRVLETILTCQYDKPTFIYTGVVVLARSQSTPPLRHHQCI